MSVERRLLTWTLRAGGKDYEDDLEQYGNKIYALGVHEIQVERTGECYIRRDIPAGYDDSYPNYGTFRYGTDKNGDGIPDLKIDRAYEFDMTRTFWKAIEKGMRRWTHIRGYLSFILFGASRVLPVLANENGEQDKLIDEIKKTLDHFATSPNYPNDPNNFKYLKGIEIDFEASLSGGSYDYLTGLNEKYIHILKRIKNEICIPRGLVLQINSYAMWGKDTPFYYRFHDYELFATSEDMNGNALIDELQIMTYDFAWNGSAPGASTPLWWFNNVATWAKQCFGAPNAKLKINKIFFGSAGYGHRWGIYDYDRMYGSTITYRNFIDWQNGLYKHNYANGDGTYTWANQEFLRFAGIEDQESKNEVLQQHIYDYFKARYGTISNYNLTPTAVISSYNGGEYATTYSRIQQSDFTNIKAEALSPSVAPVIRYRLDSKGGILLDENGNPLVDPTSKIKPYDTVSDGLTIRNNGVETLRKGVIGYRLYGSNWLPYLDPNTGAMSCKLDENGQLTYTLNMPNAGDYFLIALVSFPWYSQSKLGGTFNGSPLTIQAPNDYYPLYLKASHWFNCGIKTFNAGANTIVLNGDSGADGTAIFGFIVCEAFKNGFSGGEISFKATVKPFKKKDGSLASVPANLAVTAKALRQKSSPLMMWEDDFRIHRRLGDGTFKDIPDITSPDFSAYYQKYESREFKGGGSTLSGDLTYCYDPNNRYYEVGYSTGVWAVKVDPLPGEITADSTHVLYSDLANSGRMLVNKNFTSNYQVEAEFRAIQEGTIGISFGGSNSYDGYVFAINYKTRKVRLTLNGSLIQEEDLADSYAFGDKTKLRVISHNGKGYFYVGYGEVKAFGGLIFDLTGATGGISGFYAENVEARFYKLRICTTDKWELMEKFTIEAEVNGEKYSNTFGAVSRTGYTIDPDFGYLNYSGISEVGIRDQVPADPSDPESEMVREDISLDYEFFITDLPGFEGTADIKVKFNDPGAWLGYLYIVDKEGGSITWAGDSYSFLDTMNRAVNEFGAFGIGLWTMGQEDPRAFETIPEVVPWIPAPPGL
jgi:spore germination protein YaaH